jgi:hypothetical protein
MNYRPISLCNLCYKVITKIIANRLKPFLSRSISIEQMGFLQGRRIQDAIGTTHESLHSIKKKRLKALVLKLDLRKAYDCIDWDHLRMILLKIGVGIQMTNWIMACVTSPAFAVLINGEATDFFRSGRGVRQGCPLSPLLFILVMEGLNILLKNSMESGSISGIKVSRLIKVLHILFVDDVIIMSKASLVEWKEIFKLISLFCRASGLSVNHTKTIVYYEGLSGDDLIPFKSLLPFDFCALSTGFKYLGYFLRTGTHRASDWEWLVTKFSNKISLWCHWWLSLGGRYILVKSVLEGQSVYWMSMEALPRSVIKKIRKLIFKFLWNGHSESQHYHLCSWETLSRPKKNGGWGFRNLYHFNTALITNTLWRVLNHESLWHQVIMDKYLQNATLTNWLRKHSHFFKAASRIWSSLVRTTPIILHWLSWRPGAGHLITIGRDRILNIGDNSFLHPETISFKSKKVTVLAQATVAKDPITLAEKWKSNNDLGLTGFHSAEWESFILELNKVGVTLNSFQKMSCFGREVIQLVS